jgi:glutamine cyclotransferase
VSRIAPLKRAVKSTIVAISQWRIPTVAPIVVRTLPHDPETFTQGLAYDGGFLYESSGSHDKSNLVCRRVADWSIQARVSIPNDFAEGIAICQDRLYQINWKSQQARIYSLRDLKLIGKCHYHGQGWGLCRCGEGMLMSNGTGFLTYRDADFQAIRTMRVTQNRLPTRHLNDLEYAQDSIYANVLFRSELLEISPLDGRVTRVVDCTALKAAANPKEVEHVFNGICYRPDKDTYFVTGKCWPLMFEVRIPRRGEPRE